MNFLPIKLPKTIADRRGDDALFTITTGLECEGVRITDDAHIALTPHPPIFGNKLHNPYITVDYAEQQVEVISPALPREEATYHFMKALRKIVVLEARKQGELLWPLSLPPCVPGCEENIEIAHFDDSERGRASRAYREELARRYGMKKQLISGVHYNFSISEELLELCGGHNEAYMKVARNYHRYGWLLVYLLGASPSDSAEYPYSISKRNGGAGYRNQDELYPDCSSLESYCESVQSFIEQGFLSEAKELYTLVRLKSRNPRNLLESLKKDGIAYLEIRSIDLNPFELAGIAYDDLLFLHAFTLYTLLKEEASPYHCWLHDADQNLLSVADFGRDPQLELHCGEKRVNAHEAARCILQEIAQLAEALGLSQEVLNAIESVRHRAEVVENLYATRVKLAEAEEGTIAFGLRCARENFTEAYSERWLTPGFEDWEMSTQLLIEEALKRGIRVEPIDSHDNIIRLIDANGRIEYAQQATKTSADSYITPLLMNNKVVTKKILDEAGINVPQGSEFTREQSERALSEFENRPAVVKPKSTNFGQGITIFEKGASLEQLKNAAEFAFGFDDVVIVETFIPGLEYRFLVIDGEVAGVLHRAPAQVKGDGTHSIAELVEEKNKHPYRSTGYRTPLISIQLGESELEYLDREGRDASTVPAKDEVVFLRPNSNISTGGDSIDVTDVVAPIFKERAAQAARAFGAAFCGVDMIIENLEDPQSSWGIIEVNFNPAIHIHSFPMIGNERNIAALVLDTIFKE